MNQRVQDAVDRVLAGLMAYKLQKVILFGSYARGDFDEYSDIDLVVIKDTDERFVQRLVSVMAFVPRDVAADVFVYTPQEFQAMIQSGNSFIEQVLKDGITIYESTPGDGETVAGPSGA